MKAKELVYNMILDIWAIAKAHAFQDHKLTDDEWQAYIDAVDAKAEKYKLAGIKEWILYRGIVSALTDYLEKSQKEFK